MNIQLHIERLVLDGLPVGQRQAAEIQAGIAAELQSLLAARGLAPALHGGAAVAGLSGGTVQLGAAAGPNNIARQVANAVHAGLGTKP